MMDTILKTSWIFIMIVSLRVFKIADYEYKISFLKFKMMGEIRKNC